MSFQQRHRELLNAANTALQRLKAVALCAMIAGALLVVVWPARRRQPVPAGRVEVIYWDKWSGREAENMKRIVAWFNRTVGAEKGIWVSYISMSNVELKMLNAMAAGVPPDVAGCWNRQVAMFGEMNALEDLTDLAAARNLSPSYYKRVYYEGCVYQGRLFALPATSMAAALYWNRQIFAEHADALRAAGLDPQRPPKTMQELDRYAAVLDVWTAPPDKGGTLLRAGFLPQEPGWYIDMLPFWYGGGFYDPKTDRLTIADPRNVEAFEWIRGFTLRLGLRNMSAFRASFPTALESPQNPFVSGTVAMVLQGPWLVGLFDAYRPEMNRLVMSKEQERSLPLEQRRENYGWAVAPFPAGVPGLNNVTYAGCDVLAIPRDARHKAEAFEFLAFVQRQDVMETLCTDHCCVTPLAQVSAQFLENHRNPYIDVFERLAASPNAHTVPSLPIWPQTMVELRRALERTYLLESSPEQALRDVQQRVQLNLDRVRQIQAKRNALRAEDARQAALSCDTCGDRGRDVP